MGEEITTTQFTKEDFMCFKRHLQCETEELRSWFNKRKFSSHKLVAGYEMEAWLIDKQSRPAVCNEQFLKAANTPLYTAELAQFNIELNSKPANIQAKFLSELEANLQQHWLYCKTVAESIGCRVLSAGILQTLCDADLDIKNISPMLRFKALNEQVLLQRKGTPLRLNINGHQSLKSEHQNVMLEAAATSLQIHLQAPIDMAHHYYNASLLISAPMVAISANSPYMFGKDLWAETRIPVFEQSVDIGGYSGAAQGPLHRVSFGTDYARHSLMECFDENLLHFPVLLPMKFSDDRRRMRTVSLHNGTIWRWNRPLIGFDNDGTPHLRIEHRVIPSGPCMLDNVANMAFYFGLVHYYASGEKPPSEILAFSQARDNFYKSARYGLQTKINWPGNERCDIRYLILNKLINHAEKGLNQLKLDAKDIEYYLNVIYLRAEKNQTGSQWQREFIARNGTDMTRLLETYYRNQQTGEPVHSWDYASDV